MEKILKSNKRISRLLVNILNKFSIKTEEANPPYVMFGIFGIISFPSYHAIWVFANAHGYDSLLLRSIAAILCIPLAFKKFWPKKITIYLPLYWNLVLLYGIPFLFTFMTLKNEFSFAWSMNAMTALVLFILLVNIVQLVVLLPLGVFLGVTCYILTGNAFSSVPQEYLTIIITYGSVIIFGALFAYKKDMTQKEKITAIAAVGASIAHELRTPLASISANAGGVKEYLPDLIQTYEIAKNHSLPVAHIRPTQFKLLYTALDDIKDEANFANTIINMLLVNVDHPDLKEGEFEVCSIAHCIDESLRRYPFFSNEKNLVRWENKADFLFKGKELLTIHILFNLFKNALYYIKAAGKGEITLRVEPGEKINRFYFCDTGKGIPAAILPYIFDRFFTQTHHGSGIGLAFCKRVMQGYGGNITCRSKEGEYTEFILEFPLLKKAKN